MVLELLFRGFRYRSFPRGPNLPFVPSTVFGTGANGPFLLYNLADMLLLLFITPVPRILRCSRAASIMSILVLRITSCWPGEKSQVCLMWISRGPPNRVARDKLPFKVGEEDCSDPCTFFSLRYRILGVPLLGLLLSSFTYVP